MNYQADSDECDAIEADATRRELYGWIDNVDDCMQEGLWQVDRQRASDPANRNASETAMEARCPQTTDAKHRLYRCETCGLFSAFCGHCKRQKLPLDGSTCSCVWPAAGLPAEHTLETSTADTGGAPVRSSMGLTVAACTQLTSRKVYGVALNRLGVLEAIMQETQHSDVRRDQLGNEVECTRAGNTTSGWTSTRLD